MLVALVRGLSGGEECCFRGGQMRGEEGEQGDFVVVESQVGHYAVKEEGSLDLRR